tara:strand:+ start:254 stop:751 length:498 start_codon:yes stop_codon:yes gene_type:complete
VAVVNRYILLILLPLFSFCSLASDNLAIIAFPKEAKISDNSCTHYLKNKTQYCHDGVIELVYEVDEVLNGKYDEDKIKVVDFVHKSGFPSYLTEFPLVMILKQENGYYFLVNNTKIIDLGDTEGVCIDGLSFNFENYNVTTVSKDSYCNKVVSIPDFKTLLSSPK